MTDLKKKIKDLFHDIYAEGDFKQIVRENFSEDYVQHVDGKTLGLEEFIQHIEAQKKIVDKVEFYFEHLVQEGNKLFSIHIVTVDKKDGSMMKGKVIALFEFFKDKIILCDELTRLVEGCEEDRDLGSIH